MKISDWIFIVFRHIWVKFWAYIRPLHFLGFAPLILGIKTAKHFSEMFCIIFYLKLSQSKYKIILPTFSNIHCVKNQSKPRKCPPNYVPWPSNKRAFITVNVKINNKRALFYNIYMGNRLWKYKSGQISIFKGTISGFEDFTVGRSYGEPWHWPIIIIFSLFADRFSPMRA